jgi:hypothetical protein
MGLAVQDRECQTIQMEKLQDQMRDQTKLLEHQAEKQAKTWSQRLFGGE